MTRRRRRGLTLIEVMIAAILLGAIVAITFQILYSAQTLYNEASIAQNVEDRCRRFLDSYKGDWPYARIDTIAEDGSSVRYSIPIGSDAQGNPVFGYRFNGDQTGWEVELAFVPDNIYREPNGPDPGLGIPTQILSYDINKDGDQTDTIASGRIVQNIYDGAGTLVDQTTVSEFLLLQVDTTVFPVRYDGDLNGDGQLDPLFSVLDVNGAVVAPTQVQASGVKLRVNVTHGNFSDRQIGFVLRSLRDEVNFQNPQ